MHRARTIVLSIAVPLTLACPVAASQETRPPTQRPYQFRAGDHFWIRVDGKDSVTAYALVVRSDGRVYFRPAGEIVAVGKTVAELREEFGKALPGRKITITAGIDPEGMPREPGRTTVLGKVHQPMVMLLRGDLRLRDLIDAAGGFSADADRAHITILHADLSKETVDLRDAKARGPLLQARDVVEVPTHPRD